MLGMWYRQAEVAAIVRPCPRIAYTEHSLLNAQVDDCRELFDARCRCLLEFSCGKRLERRDLGFAHGPCSSSDCRSQLRSTRAPRPRAAAPRRPSDHPTSLARQLTVCAGAFPL